MAEDEISPDDESGEWEGLENRLWFVSFIREEGSLEGEAGNSCLNQGKGHLGVSLKKEREKSAALLGSLRGIPSKRRP